MTTNAPHPKLRVLVVGGGVAALETTLALSDLAAERTDVTVLAPNSEFVYRPMTVREPFALPSARRYPLASIVTDAGATLMVDSLDWAEHEKHTVHTKGGTAVEYDVLVLALGAHAAPRFEHAVTVDDRQMDEALHGLVQDVEGGYIKRLAFVSPGRIAWQLPLYELALMMAGRAYDSQVELGITIITPEDSPLSIFGADASRSVSQVLSRAGIETINSAYVEVPKSGEVVINPGDRRLHFNRVIALPELYGPGVRGLPLAEHGFLSIDQHAQVRGVEDIYAAGDATDFAIKHGGLGSQQADAAAEAIAARAGADVTPEPFRPVIHGMLLTDGEPLYLSARIAGGQGYGSEVSFEPTWPTGRKLATKYLAPYLDRLDRQPIHA